MSTKTVMMKLNRSFTLRSTLGHMLTFKKDVPMPVPLVMVRSCAAIGAERVDGEEVFKEEKVEDTTQPIDPGERLEDVRAAIDEVVATNAREDFTAAGVPNVKSVSAAAGYKVDRSEVLKAWRQRAEDLANEAE